MSSYILRQPATRWQDALPVGNGQVGAMMYGNICVEQILLNHEALWYPEGTTDLADLSDLVPRVRRLVKEGRFQDAAELYAAQNEARGGTASRTSPYQPLGDIKILAATAVPFRSYRRGIDLRTGEARVQWVDGGIHFERRLFVSRADDIVVLSLRADVSGSISARVKIEPHDVGKDVSLGGFGAPEGRPSTRYDVGTDAPWIRIEGTLPSGEEFGGLGRVTARGGSLGETEGYIEIDGADEALVVVALYANESHQASLVRLRERIERVSADYGELLRPHASLHQDLFERTQIHLIDADSASAEAVDDLLLRSYDGDVPTRMISLMHDFGRYLSICSGRPGGWPANLQGVWNGDYRPAWSADYHNDENIQMNYWACLPGMLPEIALPMFDYYERYLDDYRENARRLYGCRGILLPVAQSLHGGMYPGIWCYWTGGAGWLGQHFYDYYLYTLDLEFLSERAVPWLRETAEFYEDFLYEGEDGYLEFCPSLSPENVPLAPGSSMVTVNATMDVAICREVLANLCAACSELGIEAEGVSRWRAMLEKLPPYAINEDGALKEWIHGDYPDNYHHRHQSHIYPLFPGVEITAEADREIYEACRNAMEKRLIIGLASQSGWSMAHMANVYARLGEGNRALECLEILVRSSTGANLLTYHNDWRAMGMSLHGWGHTPPFQIDANFGITAAVLEMLVFSRPGLIKILPALPDRWSRGSAGRIACRGGVTVELSWDMGRGCVEATLASCTDQRVVIRFPGDLRELSLSPSIHVGEHEWGEEYRTIELPRNTPVRVTAYVAPP